MTTGRTSLDRNSQRNIKLAAKIGEGLANKLDKLFNSSLSNWEALRENLQIKETDEYTFWEFLWNVLVVDWLKNSSEDVTQKLIKEAFGGEYCSMRYLIASQPALPNGLYGKVYRQLVRLEKIRYVIEGILAEKQYFEKIVDWQSFQQNCQPSHVVCNTVWQDVKKLLNESNPANTIKLRFADVLKWELGDKQVSPKTAVALGQIVTRDFLKQLQSTQSHTKEYDCIKAELRDVCFLSQDNSYVLASKLLVKNNSEEERLLAAFAPKSRLLHCDYTDTNLDFFLACREQRETIEPDEMVKWAVAVSTEEKQQAVREYLIKGERKQIFIPALQADNSTNWLEKDRGIQELFNINIQEEKVQKAIEGKIFWNEVNSSFEDENQNQITPEITTGILAHNKRETLEEIYSWWTVNHVAEIEKYNQRLYPMEIDQLEQQLQNRDRSAWLMLFFLGATHTMGRTKHEQHKGFITFCLDKGWWDIFSQSDSRNLYREWMSVLDDYMEDQLDDTKWYYWMEKFSTIYRIARYLDDYIQSFLAVDRMNGKFDLHHITAPRTNSAFQGGGADAPPLRLGIGANFIVRELVRLNIVEPTEYVIPHCFVPRANVRRLFTCLGCSDLNIPDSQNSTKIHDF
ncbi:MAG: hypothetical protein HC836_41065 [Richelia sp. RM2_1_2]|nr:hypothetical protein [Richelia sp. RM2_1_2]